MSVHTDGTQGDFDVKRVRLSADGSHVAFDTSATTLVDDDKNGKQDVFVHDLSAGTTERVSVGPGGEEANASSIPAGLSAEGRFVAFTSAATNLVPNDTNGVSDVFVRDRAEKTTMRVSRASDGSEANGASHYADISADGTTVVFSSSASNLVPGDTNGWDDVFVFRIPSGEVELAERGAEGQPSNGDASFCRVNADGSVVVFESNADNLVPNSGNERGNVYVQYLSTGEVKRVNSTMSTDPADADGFNIAISGDGSRVAFATYFTSLTTDSVQGNGDVFLHDLATDTTTWVSAHSGHEGAFAPSLNFDGSLVAYHVQLGPSTGPGGPDTEIYVYEATSGARHHVSVDSGGTAANAMCFAPSLSAAGTMVAFETNASNLISDDTNGRRDAYVVPTGISP